MGRQQGQTLGIEDKPEHGNAAHEQRRCRRQRLAIHRFGHRFFAFALALCMLGLGSPTAWALETQQPDDIASTPVATDIETTAAADSIAIIHSNDVHCSGLETSASSIGYAGVAAAVNQAQAEYGDQNVTLVDAGDAIQGKPIGTLSEGGDLVDIMNYTGYTVAALGNHEFDYGMQRLFELQNQADYQYVCANMKNTETGELVFDPYVVHEYTVGGETVRVAYVGITTPTTLTATNPAVFENAAGNLIYSFYGDATGQALYDQVQAVVDEARSETGGNADYVIALAHLGAQATSSLPERWTSTEVVHHTTGIDAVIDGHTHLIYNDMVENADGQMVSVAQAGTAFQVYGTMVITPDDTPGPEDVTSTITEASADQPQDEAVAGYVASLEDELAQTLDEPVGTSNVFFQVFSPNEEGQPWYWTARMRETNLGDFVADAYRKTLGADIGFVNGGGIRWNWDGDTTNFGIRPGTLTYGNAIDINPFANSLSVVELDGQTILDALEFSVRQLTPARDDETEANGGFLQVSGLSFQVRLDIPSPVVTDGDDNYVGIDGQRRVSNVMVGDQPLDPAATYTVASITFLLDGGSGYTMLRNSDYLVREASLDYEALIKYIQNNLQGTIGTAYENPEGDGRIELLLSAPEPEPEPEPAPTPTPPAGTGDGNGATGGSQPSSAGSLPTTGDQTLQSLDLLLIVAVAATGALVVARLRLTRASAARSVVRAASRSQKR